MQTGYLDPASGSILASAIVGGAAAFGVAAKSARSRIAGAFRRKSSDGVDGSGGESAEVSTGEDLAVEAD